MFTGSITENRISVGLPPPVRQALYDEARLLGMQVPEFVRHILLRWEQERENQKGRSRI